LQIKQTIPAQAAIIQFAYVLYLVYTELHGTALAFGVRIGLTFKRALAAVAVEYFVFGGDHVLSPEDNLPESRKVFCWNDHYNVKGRDAMQLPGLCYHKAICL
jgi:hypothetical protein